MRNDQIFVLMLVILLPMSGCFDGAVGDAEGNDAEDNVETPETIVINNYYNNTTLQYNSPPVIFGDMLYSDYWDSDQGILIEDVLTSSSIAWDYDGTIVAFGIDWDMDGVIDANFTEDYNQYLYRHLNITLDWINPQPFDDVQQGRNGCYQFVNLIAVDNDGASTINPWTLIFREGETSGTCTNESY